MTAEEMAAVREAVRNVVSLAQRDRALLEETAQIQIELGDLAGALNTVSLLNEKHPRWRDFEVLPNVAAAQVEAGDNDGALRTAQSLAKEWRHRCLIAVARAQTAAGNGDSAQRTLSQALKLVSLIDDDFERTQTLPQIATAQAQAGSLAEANATLTKAQKAAEAVTTEGFTSAAAWRRIAIAHLTLGDRLAAQEAMQKAIRQADGIQGPLAKENRGVALQQIVIAWANEGEFDLARSVAEMIPPPKGDDMFWERGEAFYNLARAQIRVGDVEGALESARQAEPVDDWRPSLLVEIATLQAKGGKYKEARSTAEEIEIKSRRAQAMLSIATVAARSGRVEAARRIVENLPRLAMWGPLWLEDGEAFDYRRPETWAKEYEFRGFSTMCTSHQNAEHAGDLAAAAMGFDVAAHADRSVDFAKAFNDLKFQIMGPSRLRKIAAAQAEAGDALGAMAWIRKLDSMKGLPDHATHDDLDFWPGIVNGNRIQARLGVADGVLCRANAMGW